LLQRVHTTFALRCIFRPVPDVFSRFDVALIEREPFRPREHIEHPVAEDMLATVGGAGAKSTFLHYA
jgi:hypothetical protein